MKMRILAAVALFLLCGCSSKQQPVLSAGQEPSSSAVQAEAGEENMVQGILVDATMNTVRIQTDGGAQLAFGTEGAEKEIKDGLILGNLVTIAYSGSIEGSDTSGAAVLKLADETENGEAGVEELTVSGSVKDASMNTLEVEADGETRRFTTLYADKSGLADGLKIGAQVSVRYYGTKEAFADGTFALSVSDAGALVMTGEVLDATMNTVKIQTDDGRELLFQTSDAEKDFRSGLLVGNRIELHYTGAVDGTDTSKAKVLMMTDEQ